ncbi:MAG TPA: DUF262 domain-containing protein [Tepidisphaeraceae bacterium]|nr:DUF262 domain-containing protein [Tepidisphaeraceae bacterium]
MKTQTYARLVQTLGDPHYAPPLAYRWNISDGLDVVLERRGSPKKAIVWMTWDGGEVKPPDEFYGADEGRSSFTYAQAPTLRRGMPALRMTIRDDEQLERALQRLRVRANGSARPVAQGIPVTTSKPKEADESLTEGPGDEAPLDITPDRRRVITVKKDVAVETVVNWITRNIVELRPEFQRQYVWPRKKASRLIESLLLNIPLPVHYLAEEPDGRQVVVDGQQRLTSIHAFITGRFPDGGEFRLTSLQVLTELNGKTFKELERTHQNKLMAADLATIVITADSDRDVRYEVFARINMGSERLADQELRNAMFRGPYNELLKQIAATPLMLKVMGQQRPHARFADCQLVLRFFALLRVTPFRRRGNMKQLLNQELERNRFLPQQELDTMRQTFEESLETARLIFGDRAFRRFNPGSDGRPNGSWSEKIHVGLWDSLLFALSSYKKRQIVPIVDAVREELLHLMTTDEQFMASLTSATDKPEHMTYRTRAVDEALRRLVTVPAREGRSFSAEDKKRQFDANPTCQICGQRIHDLDDAELDHVEHYWRGGATVPENARLAHRYCNRARGGR